MQWIRVIGMAVGLAALPSIGTQGMGTLGDRFVHPDSLLFQTAATTGGPRDALLGKADLLVERAVEAQLSRAGGRGPELRPERQAPARPS